MSHRNANCGAWITASRAEPSHFFVFILPDSELILITLISKISLYFRRIEIKFKMFYVETEISEIVICPYCVNKYDDPRNVSCGNSFCMPCIEFLTKEESNGFQCPVCDEFHKRPKKGFSKNLNLAKLCEKKANKVSRSSLADSFEVQLNEIKLNVNKLAKENELGVDKIKDYCDGLRNEVQLHLEESTERIFSARRAVFMKNGTTI